MPNDEERRQKAAAPRWRTKNSEGRMPNSISAESEETMRAAKPWAHVLLAVVLSVAVTIPAWAQSERLTMWGPPPKEKPQRTKAAEGFPPLPLPVVPQRRTEKKRPPAPPKLIAN